MLPYVFALLVVLQAPTSALSQDEIKEGLVRAESLYYEAKFGESIQLLARLNETLQTKPDRMQDRINAKLQLALANIGLNNGTAAKIFLSEIYALDSDYALDPQQFSPKVIALANDAKNEQNKLRCQRAGDESRKGLIAGDGAAVLDVLRSMKPKCPELVQYEADTAELLYRKGLSDYKQTNYSSAVQSFRTALSLAPKHELAAQYLELTESKLQVAGDRLLLQWQKNFSARQYKQAAADYREIAAFRDDSHAQSLNQVVAEYRKALSPLVEAWNQSCSGSDASSKREEIRNQISDLLPEPSFGEDLRSKMVGCPQPEPPTEPRIAALDPKILSKIDLRAEPKIDVKPEPAAVPAIAVKVDSWSESKSEDKPVVKVGCFQMDSSLALTRLKSRVEPEVPREVRAFIQNSSVVVRAKTRIDERGNVTVLDTIGNNIVLNNSVRTAVENWKFNPALDQNGPRCVDTEIRLVIGK